MFMLNYPFISKERLLSLNKIKNRQKQNFDFYPETKQAAAEVKPSLTYGSFFI